jgi:transcriptional regulator GlxA family with amidase domain
MADRQQAVELALSHMRAHIDTPIRLSRLSRIVGLSERSLRNAFYAVRGMSPTRCMLTERLMRVRRALLASNTQSITVTSVASEHGFYELGRFAGIYKKAFGEAPSTTLRQRTASGRNYSPEAKGSRKCLPEVAN